MAIDREVVIAAAVRTPFSKFDGVLREVPSIDLGAMVMKEVAARAGLEPGEVEELFYGTTVLAEVGLELDIPARQASLKAGFPPGLLSVTLDRACCSSLTAIRFAYNAIKTGDADIVLAVGSDNMSRTPFLAPGLRWGKRIGPIKLEDPIFELGYTKNGFNPVAVDAGEVALEFGVGRELQDRWALRSQERYAAAFREGKFQVGEELMAVNLPARKGPGIVMEKDESPRGTSLEKLAKLSTVYGSPTVTPGNAPPISAGAAAVVLMSGEACRRKGLKPLATILSVAATAVEPRYIASVPADTIRLALQRAGMSLDDMDLIEVNEAFAAMPLVSTKVLSEGSESRWRELQDKTNVNGGAIAIGHPVGASGARITMTLAHELRRRGGGYGVAAICGGLAQGEGVVLKV